MNSVSCSDSVMWYEENGSKNFTGLTGFIECGNNFSEIRCTANSKRPPFLSTNTYYGYIPVTENIQDCVINKSDVITNDDFFNNEFNPRQNNENLGFIPNRKRSIKDDDNNDTLKKFRREELPVKGFPSTQPSLQNLDSHYPRCIMEPVPISERDCENLSMEDYLELGWLLKQTHGCELYNFHTVCDI